MIMLTSIQVVSDFFLMANRMTKTHAAQRLPVTTQGCSAKT